MEQAESSTGIRSAMAREQFYGMAGGDLDGDRRLDIVAARSDAPSFILFNRRSK
ncbi:MAG: hypothetical protein ABJF23_14635 [Bryobacteraceae bacterium]